MAAKRKAKKAAAKPTKKPAASQSKKPAAKTRGAAPKKPTAAPTKKAAASAKKAAVPAAKRASGRLAPAAAKRASGRLAPEAAKRASGRLAPEAAKRASGRLATPSVASEVQAQVALLTSSDPERREDALLRLLDLAGQPGWPDVRESLCRLAEEPGELPALRAGAVRLLCSAGWVSEGLAVLGSFLGDADPGLRWRAVATLLQFDPFPRDVVERALVDPAPQVRLQAAFGLSERDRGFDPLPTVLGVLGSAAPEHRVEGLKTLVALGPDRARPALDAARRLLQDPDEAVQAFAHGALAVLGT